MKRIAMWSGPRNISTAMMRAWENRTDTVVCDEPLYAYYLAQTGLPHPGAQEVIRSQPSDWRQVVEQLLAPLPPGKTIFFQKQMAHHLLPEINTDWLVELVNCFLIRSPREMLASLVEFIPRPTLNDTGLGQQARIFAATWERTGRPPPVLDARDVLTAPREMLEAFCAAIDIDFRDEMLEWPAGPRTSDGVWGKYWYASVETSTRFGPYRSARKPLPPDLFPLLEECQSLYQQLAEHRIQV